MIPQIVISYVDRKGNRIPKAAFVNTNDAITFWEALAPGRKAHMEVHQPDGTPIVAFTHIGRSYDQFGDQAYSHAAALTQAVVDRYYSDRTQHTQHIFIDTPKRDVSP